jgi:outer membrane protein assembly factor BamB
MRKRSVFVLALVAFSSRADALSLFEVPTPDTADRARMSIFPVPSGSPAPVAYEGAFSSPPMPHWTVPLPGGQLNAATHTERTRPTVSGQYLYVGSAAGEALYMLSRRDGGLVRAFPAHGSVESAAVVVGDRVYFSDTGGTTFCYTLDGQLVWEHASDAPILVEPTVAEGRLYVTTVDNLGVALDAETGALIWQYREKPDLSREAELALFASPQAVVVGDLVLLGFSNGALVALDRERGDVAWTRRIGEGRYPDLVASPVTHGADLFASGYFKPLVAIDLATQNVRWRFDRGAAAAVGVDERDGLTRVYHPGTDGTLRAIGALTGAEQWMWDSETDGALTTPLVTPAGLLLGSSEGSVYLIDPDTGKERWRYDEGRILDGVTSGPVVAGRQLLFVTNAGNLHSMLAPSATPSRRDERWSR